VSSFNLEGYQLYGRSFVETFLVNMPHESELLLYTESDPALWEFPDDIHLKLLNLRELPSFDTLHTIYNSLAVFQSDYRYQIGKFFPKVWALIGAAVEYDGVLCWIDADTTWTAPLPPAFIEGCLNGQDMAVLNRNRWHLCSSFLIIDCLSGGAQTFIKTLADMYGRGEVLFLHEWHDAFVIESIIRGLVNRCELTVSDITTLLKLPCPPGPHNIFNDVFQGVARHYKGIRKREAPPPPLSRKDRYVQLSELAAALKPKTFLEFGTWQGDRAIEVARVSPGLSYVGIDLFETGTEAMDRTELNVKSRITARACAQRLTDYHSILPNAVLFAGDSRALDAEFVAQYTGWAELIFVDGGHSLATIESDLKNAFRFRKPGGVIVLDDYYSETPPGFTERWGCNLILEAMGIDYEVLPRQDPIKQGGSVQMVIVRSEPAANEPHYSYAYIVGQRAMHAAYPTYGRTALKWGERINDLIERYWPRTVLDYGCGKGELRGQLRSAFAETLTLSEYDPGIPGKQAPPEPAELVFALDVLEHIEPEYLEAVLKHIRSLTERAAFFTVATREAKKTLPDGRNSHLILKSAAEWESVLEVHFHIVERTDNVTERGEVVLLCEPQR
jgi:SAM-dependent methyltransferase